MLQLLDLGQQPLSGGTHLSPHWRILSQQQCGTTSTPWLYPELLNLAKTGVRTARSTVTLPTQLMNMKAVETDSLPEVCLQL